MGFSSGQQGGMMAEINVTPFVDVMLVLLIIFMVTTTVITEQEKVLALPLELPSGASVEEMLSDGLLALTLDSEGTLYLAGQETTERQVELAIEAIKLKGKVPQALISADRRIPHGDVAELMDFLRIRGVTQLAINAKKQEIE